MDERDLRGLLDQVKAGRMSRRAFVKRLTAVGLTAPMATQLLALSGVAMAQAKSTYKPTRRGGTSAPPSPCPKDHADRARPSDASRAE